MSPYFEGHGVTIYCGDCRDVLPHISGGCLFTSPPYNCGMSYDAYDDNLPQNEYFSMVEDVVSASARALRSGSYLVWNVPTWIGSRSDRIHAIDEYRAILDRHCQFVDAIVWDKGPARGAAWGNFRTTPRIRAQHEWLLVTSNSNRPAIQSDIEWDDWSRLTTSIWRVQALLPYRNSHPATFPVEIPSRVLRLYSGTDDVVVDPFAGVGTVGDAAIALGRRCVLIEKSEAYCELAANRFSEPYLFPAGSVS